MSGAAIGVKMGTKCPYTLHITKREFSSFPVGDGFMSLISSVV